MANVVAVVEVDAAQVLRLLDVVQEAQDPPSISQWLRGDANDYLVDRILARFQYEGDSASGSWLPLAESTRRVRQQLGFGADGPINERTQELETFLLEGTKTITADKNTATMTIPEKPTGALEAKLRTAQQGRVTNPIPEFGPTPARPVLAVDDQDVAYLLNSLRTHIALRIGVGL